MEATKKKTIINIFIFSMPLLLFAILLIPYNLINQQFIVNWFGCGCPQVDELGNTIYPDFNANDFTALFWSFISICATVISIFLSKRIPKDKLWLKIMYIVGVFATSLLISYQFCQIMMWK